MPKFTRYYLAETEAVDRDEAERHFEDDGAEFGATVTLIDYGDPVEHKPVESGVSIVICVRDPDWDNAYEVFPGDQPGVEIFDIDLGRSDLSDADELAEWRESHAIEVQRLRDGGHTAAADHYQAVIDGVDA